MSNPRAKAERSAVKDERQAPTPDREPPRNAKKKKPVVVECRFLGWGRAKFSVLGRYAREEVAKKVMADQERKHPGMYEMRIRGRHESP